jgi:hypothetical protein
VQADTITVVGVVIIEPTGERRGGIEVGLYCDDMKNCKLGLRQSTNASGMYGLSKGNLAVKKVFVIYEGSPSYTAEPVPVPVDCPAANNPCVLFAVDLRLQPPPRASSNLAAAKWINAFGNTQSVKVWAGHLDLKEANEATARESSKILGWASRFQRVPAERTLTSVYSMMRELPDIEGLPKLDV